jgi:hypothetical protein
VNSPLFILRRFGQVQVLANLTADRHVAVEEGKEGLDAVETVVPGTTVRP